MKIATYLLSVVVTGLIVSNCGNSSKEKTAKGHTIEQLVVDTTSSKHTFFFRFVNQSQTDSSIIYTAKSLYQTDTVGLNIEVMKDIAPGIDKEGQPNEDQGFRTGSIRLSTIGSQSDVLVAGMGSLFKLSTAGKMTSSTINPLVFSSNKNVVNLSDKGTYSFKLFLPNLAGDAAEVFAVLDLYKQSFELSEKDSTFRKQLISAFEGN